MYDSLHSVGAETVVGFCNELHAGYGNDMLTDFTQQMIYGHTTGEAFNYANTKNKSNYTEIPVIAGNINKSWANATVKMVILSRMILLLDIGTILAMFVS